MLLAKLRSTQGYLAVEEKKMGFTKKKRFNTKDVRGLQTRINLKFPEMKQTSPTQTDLIAQRRRDFNLTDLESAQVFESQFDMRFEGKFQVLKNRNVSGESPFNKVNAPPPGYLINNQKLPQNPTKQNPGDVEFKKLPLAGQLTDIGQKILDLGSRKAMHVMTLNWGVGTKDPGSYVE